MKRSDFKLTPTQQRLADAMEKHGRVRRSPGGFWGLSNGPTETWPTNTVMALERKGVVVRAHERPQAWADARELAWQYLDAAIAPAIEKRIDEPVAQLRMKLSGEK